MRTSSGAPRARRGPLVARLLAVGVLGSLMAVALVVGLHAPLRPAGGPDLPGPASAPSGAHPLASSAANATPEGWLHIPWQGGPAPMPRDSAAMVYDARDGFLLLFGGCGHKGCPLGDTWKYQNEAWTNLTPGLVVAPPARSGAAMAYDARDGYVLLFGGVGASGALGDSWVFQYGQWTALSSSAGPSPRGYSGIAYDAPDSAVLLYGGTGANGNPLGDTWSFSGGLWTNLTVSLVVSPPARASAGFAFDASDNVVVLFGGSGLCGAYCNDTWTYVAGHWANLTSPAMPTPVARNLPQMGFDDGRGLTLLYGGQNSVILGDTWGFSRGVWSEVAPNSSTSPGTRAAASGAFDPADGYYLLFGGHTSNYLKLGTWAFLTPLAAQLAPQFTTTSPGQADQFSSVILGGYGTYNVSWNFGDGTPVVAGASVGHTYLAPGTYVVTMTATDSLGATSSAAVTVSVQNPALGVALSISPASPRLGQTVTVTASATGGTSPYIFHWSGAVSGCGSTSTPAISCLLSSAGSYTISVTVTDVTGHSAGNSVSIAIAPPPATVVGPGTSSASSKLTGSSTFTAAYIVVAITAACVVGVVTYRVGQRREAARLAERPLCYAVPAWSETPADFDPVPDDD